MNLNALTSFVAIVETGSLVRASERLNVTQSTITARLKTLEAEIGQVLLNRQKSGVTLTPAGTKLLHYARVMTGLWGQAKSEAGLPEGTHSLCTLACHTDLWAQHGRPLMDRIKQDHPGMAFALLGGTHPGLDTALARGEVDILIGFEDRVRAAQSLYPLPPTKLIVCADSPDASLHFNPDYIFVDYGPDYRRTHAEHYHASGTARISFDRPDWALTHLLTHGGTAYLPEDLAQPYLDAGRLFFLREAPVLERAAFMIVNTRAEAQWPWLPALAEHMAM